MRILSGIQPSGTLHIGNYFGAMGSSAICRHKQCWFSSLTTTR